MIRQKYEFTQEQNKTIGGVATRMALTGWLLIAIGIPPLLTVIQGHLVATTVGALYIVIGAISVTASRSLGNIVKTQDFDIEHLMEALGSMQRLYTLQLVAFLLAGAAFAYAYFSK